MQKGRFIIALVVFFSIALVLPFLANLLPDYTRTLNNVPEIMSKAYIDRVVNYVVSGKKAYMVVAGSSLVVSPHVLTDGYFEKVPMPVPDPFEYADFLTNYVEMAHFKKLYAQTSPADVLLPRASIVDLGVPSLMLSDGDLLFEKLQRNDALPESVVLLLAPRDFMDNIAATKRNLFVHEINGRITLKELLNSKSAQEFFANIYNAMDYGGNIWCKQFRTCGQRVALAVKKLGKKPRNETLAWGPTRQAALHNFYFGDGTLPDLGIYKKRYQPADHGRIEEQLAAMDRLLDRLNKESIHTVVVNMPLTKANLALIDQTALREIQTGMKASCARAKVRFIDAQQFESWDDSNFVDSVHLNATGGDKFFQALTRRLSDQSVVNKKIQY